MKILKIEIIRIAIPFSSGRVQSDEAGQDFNAASPNLDKMESLIVKVHCDNDFIGWGEAFGHLINPVVFVTLEKFVAPYFLGKEFSTLPCIEQLMKDAEYAFHGFGRTGPIRYALSAIDIALWDLLGQALKKPLWQLLGGTRKQISIYPSLVSYQNDPIVVSKKVAEVVAQGYTQIKLHETEFEAIKAAKDVLPAQHALMVDVNCCWNAQQACTEIEKLKTLNLKWLEEPVWPVDDFNALKSLNTMGISISAGENLAGEQDAYRLIQNKTVDIIQPSVAKIGGITAVLNVIKYAKTSDMTVVPHCFYYGPGLLATAHLVTLLPPNIFLEVPYIQFSAHLHALTQYQPHVVLPETAGLGFQINAEVLKKYTIDFAVCMNQGV